MLNHDRYTIHFNRRFPREPVFRVGHKREIRFLEVRSIWITINVFHAVTVLAVVDCGKGFCWLLFGGAGIASAKKRAHPPK